MLLLIGPGKVKVFMGQAESPKCKLPMVSLGISGMFSVQSISYFPARESCDNKDYFSVLTTLKTRIGEETPFPGNGLEVPASLGSETASKE